MSARIRKVVAARVRGGRFRRQSCWQSLQQGSKASQGFAASVPTAPVLSSFRRAHPAQPPTHVRRWLDARCKGWAAGVSSRSWCVAMIVALLGVSTDIFAWRRAVGGRRGRAVRRRRRHQSAHEVAPSGVSHRPPRATIARLPACRAVIVALIVALFEEHDPERRRHRPKWLPRATCHTTKRQTRRRAGVSDQSDEPERGDVRESLGGRG